MWKRSKSAQSRLKGSATSTAGFIGEAERGPIVPRLVNGFEKFRRLFGGYTWTVQHDREPAKKSTSFLSYAVEGFFANGGKRCFLNRVVGKDSKIATLANIEAAEQDKPSGIFTPSAANAAEPQGEEKDEKGESTSTSGPELEPPGEGAGDKKKRKGNPRNADLPPFTISALGPGTWGNRIGITIEKASLFDLNPNLFKIVVKYWTDKPGQGEPTIQEDYDNLSCNPASTDFYEKQINNQSSLIKVMINPDVGDMKPSYKGMTFLQGGEDGAELTLADYKGVPGANPGERTGLGAFEEIDEISIVCAPNENDVNGLSNALVTHCDGMKDRFAVLQASQSAGDISKLWPSMDSKYAAFYYPWIKVIDPTAGMPKLIPPGGHIAGIYARTDTERGVHKAPANEVVRGAVGIQFALTKGDQDILNPRGVNCIRAFPGRGIRIWGARTMASDPLWKYVNVRRLFLFLEESIEEGTQWVVFEPNDQRLWDRVRQTVSGFLTRVWKDGALMGNIRDEAFFVKCDETTMTQNDIETGRLIVLIGVAPVRPAEFVIFRIAQWRGGSAVAE